MDTIKNVFIMLFIAASGLIAFFLALIPIFNFEDGNLLKGTIYALIMWPSIYGLYRIDRWLWQSGNSSKSELPRNIPASVGRQVNYQPPAPARAGIANDSFRPALSNRASFSAMSDPDPDPQEKERIEQAKILGSLRSRTDEESLKQAIEFLDHNDFELRGMALDVVSYRFMGGKKPGLEKIIEKIQQMFETLICDYDAGKITREEVKEVGEGCLLALFRIGGWSPELMQKKAHIPDLAEYMAEFMPKENPYEDYQPMKDPEAANAANPSIDWINKKNYSELELGNLNADGKKFRVSILINRKICAIAFAVDGEVCPIVTRLAHTDSYNSGDRKYTVVRPESPVVFPGKMLKMSDQKIRAVKPEYNEYRKRWEGDWRQMESGEVYNTVVYEHHSVFLELWPAEKRGLVTIFTSVDMTT
ncbi:MAG: hypothetical protein ACOYXC_01355 [Candidatus Rifleibacteriota bacterium]